jgi:hypothetical protein
VIVEEVNISGFIDRYLKLKWLRSESDYPSFWFGRGKID